MDGELLKELTIPLFTGAIGYLTNWSGVWMLFYPVSFAGWRLPGLKRLAPLLPRRIQQIPGVMQGGVGWQGIIPSRAAKMGSIAVDKGIAKLGSPSDFYRQLEPEAIAEHILDTATRRTSARSSTGSWSASTRTPGATCRGGSAEAVHARVQQQLPDIVRTVTDEIGAHIDQLLDIKLMVIRRIEENPEMANRIYLEVGRKELRFIINFGFFFGALLGVPLVFLTQAYPALVGAADRRRDHRLRHQLGGALDDLRAGRAAPDRAAQAARPVHPAPTRGIRGLWRDHRGGHRHAREHRRRAPARPAGRTARAR